MSSVNVGRNNIKLTSPGGTGGGTTPISVNTIAQGTINNGVNIEIDVDDKNGNPITPVITKVGNTLNLDIAGQTPLQINATPAGFIDNWDTIFIDVDDKNGNPLTQGVSFLASIVGNTINLDISGTTPLQVNGGASIGVIPNWDLADIRLRDQSANVVPLVSSSISGSQVTLNINNNPAPSGVLLQAPTPEIYTLYQNGDAGWRFQNGWYDYVAPTNPAKIAELDYTQNANWQFLLKTALSVNGVSSTRRFVDVLGGQTFPAANNCNVAVLDKLTGLLWYRQVTPLGTGNWADAITASQGYSVTINGITYSDWFIPTIGEFQTVWQYQHMPADSSLVDTITGVNLILINGLIDQMWSATTQRANTANALTFTGEKNYVERIGKTATNMGRVYIHKAFNLIS